MAFEHQMLSFMTLFFLFAWLPSSMAKGQTFGIKWLASNRESQLKEMPSWGGRAERAYANLKDYFPAYVVAILLLGQLNKFDECTTWAAGLYVLGRLTHFISYIAGNFIFRFLSYILALGSNAYLLIRTLM